MRRWKQLSVWACAAVLGGCAAGPQSEMSFFVSRSLSGFHAYRDVAVSETMAVSIWQAPTP